MQPKLVRIEPSATKYNAEIDSDIFPWPTLTLWDMSSTPRQWFEWGVFPSQEAGGRKEESSDGTFGSICFRFDAGTGRLYGVEIPSNLVEKSMWPCDGILNIEEGDGFDVFADVAFWMRAVRPRQRAINTPISSYVSQNEFRIEFMDEPLVWIPLSHDVWLAKNSEALIAGIRCKSSSINFDNFVSAM